MTTLGGRFSLMMFFTIAIFADGPSRTFSYNMIIKFSRISRTIQVSCLSCPHGRLLLGDQVFVIIEVFFFEIVDKLNERVDAGHHLCRRRSRFRLRLGPLLRVLPDDLFIVVIGGIGDLLFRNVFRRQ